MTSRVFSAFAMTLLMVLSVLMVAANFEESTPEVELIETVEPSLAPSDPGHTVFAQYITSDNCGYCYQYGSPAHDQAKNALPDRYVYISYHSANFGNTADAESGNIAPIYGVNHLQESGGAPKTSFGDATLNTGCGSNTCWDSYISSGGNMHSTAADYAMTVGQSDNGDGTVDITVSAKYTGSGTPASSYVLYAAVTEKVCHSHAYADGSKGHNCWEGWLLNNGGYASNAGNVGGGTGFETITLTAGQWTTKTWTVPTNLVAQGVPNMNTVAALFSGWSTTSFQEDVYVTADATMQPPIDVAVTGLSVENQDGLPGFVAGDTLDLEVTVENNGADTYADGGTIQLHLVEGASQTLIDSTSLNTLTKDGSSTDSQTFSATFDTTGIAMQAHGASQFKASITGLTGDGNGANNYVIDSTSHDMEPSADMPMAAGSTNLPRGGTLDFDVTPNAQDQVDSIDSMTPEFEVSPAGQDLWTGNWVEGGDAVVQPGTQYERYVFTVEPLPSLGSGEYDARARFTDARGQTGAWVVLEDAFSLLNGLPAVVDPTNPDNIPPNCAAYPGIPTVKVDFAEMVDLNGLVCDAETPLENLVITSSDPAFIAWHPSTNMIEVKFTSIAYDSVGNPLPSGLTVTIDDGEDQNTGMLKFNVIENGQPRWNMLPTQSFDEGGSTSIQLSSYVTDTDENGNPTSTGDLDLRVVSVTPEDIVIADVFGQTLNLESAHEDAMGTVTVVLRADDGTQTSDTEMTVHVQNVNDEPRADLSSLTDLVLQAGDEFTVNLSSLITDVDGDDAAIWTTVTTTPAAAAQLNPLDGMMTLRWDGAGDYTVTISSMDDMGAVANWQVPVSVVSALPLAWSIDGTTGDLDLASEVFIGSEPAVTITQLSDDELSEISISWAVCNTDSGICSDFGTESPETLAEGYAFTATMESGGMIMFDQIKLTVTAVDANGISRESEEVTLDAAEVPDTTGPVDDGSDDEPSQSGDEPVDTSSGSMSIVVIGGIAAFVALILVALVMTMMVLRSRSSPEPEWGAEPTFVAPGAAPMMAAPAAAPAPAAPAPAAPAPAAPAHVPDYTHLPVGGSYVTGTMGETVYMAADGTQWTMQADNSFTRTA